MELIDPRTGKIDLAHAPDEISFEVEEFNKAVVTVPFNKTVAEELARHIDPNLPGKTLIFAVSDAHADIVVAEVKKAFSNTRAVTSWETVLPMRSRTECRQFQQLCSARWAFPPALERSG